MIGHSKRAIGLIRFKLRCDARFPPLTRGFPAKTIPRSLTMSTTINFQNVNITYSAADANVSFQDGKMLLLFCNYTGSVSLAPAELPSDVHSQVSMNQMGGMTQPMTLSGSRDDTSGAYSEEPMERKSQKEKLSSQKRSIASVPREKVKEKSSKKQATAKKQSKDGKVATDKYTTFETNSPEADEHAATHSLTRTTSQSQMQKRVTVEPAEEDSLVAMMMHKDENDDDSSASLPLQERETIEAEIRKPTASSSSPEEEETAVTFALKAATCKGTGPAPRWGHSCVSIDEHSFLLYGGDGEDETYRDMFVYHAGSDTWEVQPTVTNAIRRVWHAACYSPRMRSMIVHGGECDLHDDGIHDDEKVVGSDMVVYDLQQQCWYTPETRGTPLGGRSGHTATLCGDTVIFFGGLHTRHWTNSVHALDLNTWRWSSPTVRGTPPPPRSYHSASALSNDRVLIFGGNDDSAAFQDVYVLDVPTYTWVKPRMKGNKIPAKRTGHVASVCSVTTDTSSGPVDMVLVYGGWDYQNANKTVYYSDMWLLDTSSWQWHRCGLKNTLPAGDPSATGRAGSSVAVTASDTGVGKLYIFGGDLQATGTVSDHMGIMEICC